MELNTNELRFLARLGENIDALENGWPDSINIRVAIEYHGEDIASWGSVEGKTVWAFQEETK